MSAPSIVRIVLEKLGAAFESRVSGESSTLVPAGDDEGRFVELAVRFGVVFSRDEWAAVEAARHEPEPRPSVRREDITLTPRLADASTFHALDDAVTGWEAQLCGRISTGERVTLSAPGKTASAALSRLTERIDAEGWQIEEVSS